MEIQCNNCKALWPDELFAAMISGNFTGVIRSRITYGCIARQIIFLNRNRLVAGVEAGASNGATSCISNTFNDIVRRTASVAVGEKVELKCRMPLVKSIIRAVTTALHKDGSNCCLKAQILYSPKRGTDAERKRVSTKNMDIGHNERIQTAGCEKRRREMNAEYRERESGDSRAKQEAKTRE
jgi:hypothetical protein